MDLKPIILSNLPGGGDTIIEKLDYYLRVNNNIG